MKKLLLLILVVTGIARVQGLSPSPYTETISFTCKVLGTGTGSVSAYLEGGTVTATATAPNESTTISVGYVRPGQTYGLSISGSGPTDYYASFTAPTGYSVFIDGVETDLVHLSSPGGSFTPPGKVIEIRPVVSSARADAGSFSGVAYGKSVTWDVGLGGLRHGNSAGRVFFKERDLTYSANPAKRDRLYYSAPPNIGQITSLYNGPSNLSLHQIMAAQVLVDFADDPTNGFLISFYDPSQGTWNGTDYTITGSAWKTIKVESPGTSQLKIIETEGTTVHVSLVNAPSVSSGAYTWTLDEGGGSAGSPTYLRRTTLVSSLPGGGGRNEDVEVADYSTGTVATKTLYHYDTSTFGWGEEVVTMTEDPAGPARVTNYDYYNVNTQFGNYRKLKSITDPTGNWTKFDYYDDFNRRGQIQYEYHPFQDTPSTAAGASLTAGKVLSYDYDPDFSGRYRIQKDAQEHITISGTTIQTAKTTRAGTLNQTQDGQPYTIYNASYYYDSSNTNADSQNIIQADGNPDFVGLPFFVHACDGTESSFTHHYGTYNYSTKAFTYPGNFTHFRTSEFHGTSSASGATAAPGTYDGLTVAPTYLVANKSTMTVTVRNYGGLPVRTETQVYTGGSSFSLMTSEDLSYDSAGRLTQRVANNGATTTYTYTNGLLMSVVDPTGIETTYTYDVLGRVATSTKKGAPLVSSPYVLQPDIVSTYTYDAANRVRQTVTTSTSVSRTDSANFDLGGFPTNSTAAGSYVTYYTYSSGGKITTTTLPDGATRVVENYLDGQAKSITGTAQVNEFMSYSVDSGTGKKFRQHLNASWGSTDWVNSYSDWRGRPSEEWRQGWSGAATYTLSTYNSAGQLTKVSRTGLADLVYDYDTLGTLAHEGLDVNQNGTFDPTSDDRGIAHSWLFFNISTTWWKREITQTYATSNSGSATQTAKTETQLSGFTASGGTGYVRLSRQDSYDIYGNGTVVFTEVNQGAKMVVATTVLPDSSINPVQKSYNGLLIESTDRAGITMKYGYDGFGRKTTDTDPRTGTTTTAYASGTNQVSTVTDPANVVQATYTYDASGARVATVTNALSKVTRFEYDGAGNKIHEWGSATFPAEYAYDAYGRLQYQRTYRGGSNWNASTWAGVTTSTADVTTWAYHTPTGLLSSKTDAATRSTSYTYTQARQLATRTDPRSVVTTYSYDVLTGDQTQIQYSDGTPTVTYTYNRLGMIATVADAIGTRTFTYNLAGTLELQNEILGTSSGNFYGDRRITRTVDTTTTGALGRYNGLFIGDSSTYNSQYAMGYAYDTYGRTNAIWNFNYSYVANSNLIDTVSAPGWSYTDVRTYDANHDWINSRTTSVSSYYTTKAAFNYTHDNLGRVTQVAKTGELFSRYGNGTQGLTTYYGYDDRSQVTSEQTKIGVTSTVLTGRDDGLTYDTIGNRASVTHNGNTATYSSDAVNQYSSRTVPGVFDVAGAASTGATVTVNGSATGVTRHGEYFFKGQSLTNTSAVFTSLSVSDGTTTTPVPAFLASSTESLGYDLAGNLTSDGRWDYEYDGENRLHKIYTHSALCPGTIANTDARYLEFTYDYLGRRAGKIVRNGYNGTSYTTLLNDIRMLYDGWNLLLELDGNNYLAGIRIYVWGLDISGTLHGAGGIGGLLYSYNFQTNTNLLSCYDAQGNFHAGVDIANATLGAAFEYDAFGNLLRVSGGAGPFTPIRFGTKYTDDETTLVSYGLRFYSPSLGRFVGRDPAEERGGMNLYAFCCNKGPNGVDYLGMGEMEGWVYSSRQLPDGTWVTTQEPGGIAWDAVQQGMINGANNQNWMSYAEGAAAGALANMIAADRASHTQFMGLNAQGNGVFAFTSSDAFNALTGAAADFAGANGSSGLLAIGHINSSDYAQLSTPAFSGAAATQLQTTAPATAASSPALRKATGADGTIKLNVGFDSSASVAEGMKLFMINATRAEDLWIKNGLDVSLSIYFDKNQSNKPSPDGGAYVFVNGKYGGWNNNQIDNNLYNIKGPGSAFSVLVSGSTFINPSGKAIGGANFEGSNIILSMQELRYSNWGLGHELGHKGGAVHNDDRNSIMFSGPLLDVSAHSDPTVSPQYLSAIKSLAGKRP